MMSTEEWRPVVGYEGKYEVSDMGRIRRVKTGRVLRTRVVVHKGRYERVGLWRDGKSRVWQVHRLVGEAFLGPLPRGLETRHLNGDGADNRLVNLKYGTHAENMRDAVEHGVHPCVTVAFRTHCRKGHEYTEANTRIRVDGSRSCRTCIRASVARRYAAARAARETQQPQAEAPSPAA
jgi:hypothetical protein